MDEMWMLPADWFWPLLGPFTGHMIPGFIGYYFWHEITSPSEWIFTRFTRDPCKNVFLQKIIRRTNGPTGETCVFAVAFLKKYY